MYREIRYLTSYTGEISSDDQLDKLPRFSGKLNIYPSAVSMFYAPSDTAEKSGIRVERIRATPSWREHGCSKGGRYDTVFLHPGNAEETRYGIAQVKLLFSLSFEGQTHACALIQDFTYTSDAIDEETGMWVVKKKYRGGRAATRVIALNQIVRACQLLPDFGRKMVSRYHSPSQTLDTFNQFFVNKFADHHIFELYNKF